ncbi:MAG: hypothetical protein GY803_13745 [Chloroflexi bacterium]|nr:hypothetical protein [Chloroflexota bacterium]
MLSLYSVSRQALGREWNLGLFFTALIALLLIVYGAKRFIVAPRIGWVKLGPNRNIKIGWAMGLAIILATFILIFLTVNKIIVVPIWEGMPAWASAYDVDMLFTLVIIGFFHVLGYLFGVARIHLYGWLMGVGNLASTILEHEAGYLFHWPMFLAGAAILLIGAVLFVRLLQAYPVMTEGA